jgi:hypothetical protein
MAPLLLASSTSVVDHSLTLRRALSAALGNLNGEPSDRLPNEEPSPNEPSGINRWAPIATLVIVLFLVLMSVYTRLLYITYH